MAGRGESSDGAGPGIFALTWSALQVLGSCYRKVAFIQMAESFAISEAAKEAGVSVDTLRYYERAGLMLEPVERAASGHRRYGERDVRFVRVENSFADQPAA